MVLAGCGAEKDPARPAEAGPKSLGERLSESGGYKQDEGGNWVPRSDKRSSFESKGESPYFKGEYGKKEYRTGDYAKKSWWGNKDFGRQEYAGKTDGSRFMKTARQEGEVSKFSGRMVKDQGAYETKNLDRKSAREAGSGAIGKPVNERVESARKSYQAPSVIGWEAQREMSMEQSKGILGR